MNDGTRNSTQSRRSNDSLVSREKRISRAFQGVSHPQKRDSGVIVLEVDGRIAQAKYEELLAKFARFKEEKQRNIERAFVNVDRDRSGFISCGNLRNVFNKMNILPNTDVQQSAEQLIFLFLCQSFYYFISVYFCSFCSTIRTKLFRCCPCCNNSKK